MTRQFKKELPRAYWICPECKTVLSRKQRHQRFDGQAISEFTGELMIKTVRCEGTPILMQEVKDE